MSSFYDQLYSQKVKIWPSEPIVAFIESRHSLLVGRQVLDIGCGCGRHSIYMARRGIAVTGIDLSPVAIEYSRKWSQAEKMDLHFEIAASQHLPFADNSFYGVISWEALYYGNSSEVMEAIREAFRVLCPGGVFLVLLKSKDDFRFHEFYRIDENTCDTEQGLLMTCFDRKEVENIFNPFCVDFNIELMIHSIENGAKLISNFIVTGVKA